MSMYTPEEDRARQEALYAFLLERGDKWTSMEQTTDTIRLYPAWFRTTYHNSTARRLLTRDIEAINLSGRYEKIIISGTRGIKLATKDEFTRFVKAECREIFAKLRRVRTIIKKGSDHEQTDMEGEIREAFLGGE